MRVVGIPMPSPDEGFIYVEDGESSVMSRAIAGARITLNPRKPPWIVVDHTIEAICVARWPGRLWRARVVDKADVPQPLAYARYTRAASVDVLEQIPAAQLF